MLSGVAQNYLYSSHHNHYPRPSCPWPCESPPFRLPVRTMGQAPQSALPPANFATLGSSKSYAHPTYSCRGSPHVLPQKEAFTLRRHRLYREKIQCHSREPRVSDSLLVPVCDWIGAHTVSFVLGLLPLFVLVVKVEGIIRIIVLARVLRHWSLPTTLTELLEAVEMKPLPLRWWLFASIPSRYHPRQPIPHTLGQGQKQHHHPYREKS